MFLHVSMVVLFIFDSVSLVLVEAACDLRMTSGEVAVCGRGQGEGRVSMVVATCYTNH